jgi:hypothetical protein
MISSKRSIAVVAMMIVNLLVGAGSAVGTQPSDDGEHCVIEVIGQMKSGELVMSDPVCFDTFAQATFAASSGAVRVRSDTTPVDLFTTQDFAVALSSFTLGVHYDGSSGAGSSITVVGSSCSGGYWNTTEVWDNRISSTWNGCYRIKHHDLPAMGGAYASTYGVGAVHNVPSALNNAAESISYWSS